MQTRCGTVALIGRPNAGKSTLLNTLVGARIAAVSRRPQTTRSRLVGAWTREGFQAVLVDTPGIHTVHGPLHTYMVKEAEKALEEVDVACWIIDAELLLGHIARGGGVLDGDMALVKERIGKLPVVVALNKVDRVEKPALLPVLQAIQEAIDPSAIVPVCATRAQGLDALAQALAPLLPEQDFLYPEEHVTDALERQIAAELIREQVFQFTSQEVPYATAVEIERFDESARELGRVHIHAKIVCEKPSQKGILVGAGGAMIKRIGTASRKRIEELLDCKVRLDLFVAVEPDWTSTPRALRGFGYAG
jgi:GTP-binding protein Era